MANLTIYLLPPVVSLLVSLALAGIALWVPPRTTERQYFAAICLWWGMLAPAFISHHLLTDPVKILFVERCIHFAYVFLPALNLAFAYRLLGIRNPWLIRGAFVLSGVLALTTPTPYYFPGLIAYGWGYIARGGPAFQVFGSYGLATLVFIIVRTWQRLKTEANPLRRRKQSYIIFSFCLSGFLTLLNVPAMNGVDFYPAGNFVFLPLALLGYAVLKYRLMAVRSMLLQAMAWCLISSLILLPNGLFMAWLHRIGRSTGLWFFSVCMAAWFAANFFYFRKLQPAINRRFHANRSHLDRAFRDFIANAVFLKDLDALMTEFRELLRRCLAIREPVFYLARGHAGRMVNPDTGATLTPSRQLVRLVEGHPDSVGLDVLETHPRYVEVARELRRLIAENGARYVVPLVQANALVGLVLLPPPNHGEALSRDELHLLDQLPAAGLAFANSVVFQDIADLKENLEQQTAELTREIEERRQVEAALRRSEATHRFIADNLRDVIWTRDMSLALTYVSPAVERITGWTAEAYLQLPINETMPAKDLAKARAIMDRALERARQTDDFSHDETFEIDMFTRSGKTIQTEVTALFTVDADGQPTGILGVTRDVTERLRARRERKLLRERLERSKKMEALGLLAGGVAHDLNNILSGVMSYPGLIMKTLPDGSPLHKPLKTIERSGHRAAAVVDDLLTLARGMASSRAVTHLNRIVDDHLKTAEYVQLRSLHPHVNVDVRRESDPWHLNCSAVHVQKALMNLLANAMEAMDRSGVVTVTTENRVLDVPIHGDDTVPPGRYTVLSVADTGYGIADDDLKQIFEPFFTRKAMGRSGTGLGLAIVWNTMQDHDGHVIVSSGGAGTRFDLFFPVTGDPVAGRQARTSVEALKGHGEHILIVDDDATQREITAGMLKFLGYAVDAVAGGEEAVAFVNNTPVALLILDMIMPQGMNGRETYAAVSRIRPGQKAILVSGSSETEAVSAAQRLGAGALLQKPFTLEKLGEAVRTTLADRAGDGN